MPDRVKESVFGMLGTRVQSAAVLDLFAGSGALGLESLSRGAASCLFVERDRSAAGVLEGNIDALECHGRARLVLGDALGLSVVARAPDPIDLIFLDPPYPLVRTRAGWERVRAQASALAAKLAPDGFLILRTPWPFSLDPDETAQAGPDAAAGAAKRSAKPKKYKRERPRWDDLSGDSRAKARSADDREGQAKGTGSGWVYRIDGDDHRGPTRATDKAEEHDAQKDDGVRVVENTEALESLRTPADPSIPGCKGPETHPYGSTAVHWYMRSGA